ncbi:MAG: hypothetical protein ACKOFF_01830, partial [Acidimicrobiales bacterium]
MARAGARAGRRLPPLRLAVCTAAALDLRRVTHGAVTVLFIRPNSSRCVVRSDLTSTSTFP